MNPATQRLNILDLLRGIASLSVCWFHLTNGNEHFLPPGWLRASGEYGWVGVNVFFVISGFIIPYSLFQSGYRLGDYGRFLLKRILRLDPPYIAAIALIVGLGFLTSHVPGFRGPPFQVSAMQLLVHLGYANVLLGYAWLSPVFWTLAIELQYYLLVGLLFPLIISKRVAVRSITLVCLADFALLIPGRPFVFHWLFLFMLGIATFQFRKRDLSRAAYWIHWVVLTAGACYMDGILVGLAGAATALVIAFVNAKPGRVWTFFGLISYSLYLIHVPIGGRVINLAERLPRTLVIELLALALGLALSIFTAWLFYKWIERPAQRWSAVIGYRQKLPAPSGFAARRPVN